MSAHTPGPWVLTGDVRLVGNPMADGQHSLYVGEVRHEAHIGAICMVQSADHVPPHGITRDVAAANARLIAAAPELLAALQALVAHDSYQTEYDGRMLSICPDCGKQDGEHTEQCEFVLARAVIAKAAGGAS